MVDRQPRHRQRIFGRVLRLVVGTLLLVDVCAGCIPHYDDFVGAKEVAGKDQVGDGGKTDRLGTDAGFNVAQPDVLQPDQRVCVDDVCLCQPDCAGKQCGPDWCGGTCGTCSGCESVCSDGQCGPVLQADSGCYDGDIYWKDSCGTWGDKATECAEAGCKPESKVCGDCEELCSGSKCGSQGECNCGTCPAGKSCEAGHCVVKCGDGQCGGGEDKCNCPGDCTGGCAGCCQGTVCKTGNLNSECGKNGAVCAACSGGKTCQSQECTYKCGDGVCGGGEDKCNCPADCTGGCAGCCTGTVCKAGTSNGECGKNGDACVVCSGGKTCQEGECASIQWKDPTSNLTWQVTPTGGTMNWSDAKAHCSGLSLDGGGWHLPTISELRSLIRGCPGTVTDGACEVTDSCLSYSSCWDEGACWSCSGGAGPADGGMYWPDEVEGDCCWYWSSSPVEDGGGNAWGVSFPNGYVGGSGVNYYEYSVRCVR